MQKTPIIAALLLTSSLCIASDSPARKSGLWEMTNSMSGPHAMTTTMQQCVDEKTDKLTEQMGEREAKQNCSKNDVKKSGGKVVVDSVCKFEGTTATTHGEFSGDFGSNYRGDIRTSYNPPMHGMKESQMTISAKWLGPCKPGMKPGDVVMQGMPGMPGGMKFNPADMQKQMR
ncbi:MAG: DUF3617 domain-containing protein [Rhodocyclaceae bacterium]|nr:DUF3617 domain-containing protein [Rhodocyclaceae bacterium]